MRKFLIALLLVAACSGTTEVTPAPTELGTYTLVSLDTHPVPATIVEGSTSMMVISGGMTLASGGVLHMTVTYQPPGQSSATNALDGHYTRQGNSLSFTYSNGGQNGGTISGDTLRMPNEGVLWLFVRK